MAQRGKKINQVKNERAHAEWMIGKKFGRKKQVWIWDLTHNNGVLRAEPTGYWEKV